MLKSKKIEIILTISLLVFTILAITFGSIKIKIEDIWLILTGNGDSLPEYLITILYKVRLPRIIMAILIGMMLSSSGTVVQAVFQNPLADPYIIGISASAVAGAVIAYMLNLPTFFYGLFAFILSIVTTLMIFRLAMREGATKITTLLIIGVAVSAFLGAFTSFAMYAIGEDSYRIVVWTMGYLGSASWLKVGLIIIPLILSVLYFYRSRYELDALMSGDEEAHSLGIDINKTKKKLLIVSCLVVSFSVAFTGMIGFVGLIVPHSMRMIVGHSNSKLLGISTLAGGLFLLVGDTIARTLLAPVEIPIGAVTAFFGAPFFIYLAIKKNKGLEL